MSCLGLYLHQLTIDRFDLLVWLSQILYHYLKIILFSIDSFGGF